ncbi:MAG: hypothetical protein R2873_35440 [Caldilineaceae bacterium]
MAQQIVAVPIIDKLIELASRTLIEEERATSVPITAIKGKPG